MSLSARTPTGADTMGGIPEQWANLLIDEAQKELVCFDAISHEWQVGKKRGDTVNIPVTAHTTAATEVTVGSKAATDGIAGTKIQLVMDQWYEKPIDVDTMTLEQSQIDWEKECKKEAEYAIRVKIDTTVATLFSTLYTTGGVQGTDGSKVTDDLLADITELLDEADVPRDGDRFCIVDPSVIRDMMDYDKFVTAQYVSIGAIQNGTVIKGHPIYGANFRVTNNLVATGSAGAYAVMMHRKALAGAIQMIIPWVKPFEELHQVRYQHEALWGVKEVRDTFGIPFYTRKA